MTRQFWTVRMKAISPELMPPPSHPTFAPMCVLFSGTLYSLYLVMAQAWGHRWELMPRSGAQVIITSSWLHLLIYCQGWQKADKRLTKGWHNAVTVTVGWNFWKWLNCYKCRLWQIYIYFLYLYFGSSKHSRTLTLSSLIATPKLLRKIPHTGDTESLARCR